MSRIAVLGMGNWGTALALSWANDSHQVIGWTVEEEVYGSIMEKGENSKYLPGVPLKMDVTMDIGEAIEASELLVMALPSGVILSVIDDVIPHLRPSHVILDLAKGLAPPEEGGSGLISEAIEAKLSAAGLSNPVVVLTGPTIAPEVARGVITTAMVAGHDISVATRITERLSTDCLILMPSQDAVGCELWGAYKNTVALSCGVVDGLRDSIGGDNLKAALVTIGFAVNTTAQLRPRTTRQLEDAHATFRTGITGCTRGKDRPICIEGDTSSKIVICCLAVNVGPELCDGRDRPVDNRRRRRRHPKLARQRERDRARR